MINICDLIKKNIILKGIGKGKKIYNDYMFASLLDSGDYDFSTLFPRFILTRNLEWNEELKKPWVDIMYNRQGSKKTKSLMRSGLSSNLKLMWQDLGDIKKIREFIYIIEDIDFWRSCLCYYGVTEEILIERNLRSSWYKNYCSWDIYLPEYHLMIELDSDFHKFKDIDMARDRYFDLKIGIKTERFWDYSINRDKSRVDNILKYGKRDKEFKPCQIDYVVSKYLEENKKIVSIIYNILEYGYTPEYISKMSLEEYRKFGLWVKLHDLIKIKEICSP